jgi:hypothetical protein
MGQLVIFLNSVSQYYVCSRNLGLTRDPEQGTKSRGKKSAIKSRKRNPQSYPEEKIRNQIQEKKSAIKSRKINPQSNPGKEIRKIKSKIQNSSSVSG